MAPRSSCQSRSFKYSSEGKAAAAAGAYLANVNSTGSAIFLNRAGGLKWNISPRPGAYFGWLKRETRLRRPLLKAGEWALGHSLIGPLRLRGPYSCPPSPIRIIRRRQAFTSPNTYLGMLVVIPPLPGRKRTSVSEL